MTPTVASPIVNTHPQPITTATSNIPPFSTTLMADNATKITNNIYSMLWDVQGNVNFASHPTDFR